MFSHDDYKLHLECATADIQQLILTCFRYFGVLGNDMFFLASAWFLADSKQNNKKKWLLMAMDVWFINVIILAFLYPAISSIMDIRVTDIIRSFIPNSFSLNWYVTCYLLFYLAYPFFNKLIDSISRKTHFRIVFVLVSLYIVLNFVLVGFFFSSCLILWMTFYFLMSYLKQYKMHLMDNKKINVAILVFAAAANTGLIVATNYVGLSTGFFASNLIYWNTYCNPFLLLIALSGFNLVRNINWVNPRVNALASLSLFIYLIHENYIFRRYYRPVLLDKVYHAYGYDHVVMIVLAFSSILFLISAILSFIYKSTIHRFLQNNISRIYEFFARGYKKIEEKLM